MRSARGSSPKIASGSVAFPASFPSRATILSSITRPPSSQRQPPCRQPWQPYWWPWHLARRPLPPHRQRRRLAPPLFCRLRFRLLSRLLGFTFSRLGHPEFAGLRSFLGQFFLHGIAYGHPPAFGTGYRALDQDETPLNVRLYDLKIERCDTPNAEVPRHLLVLECLAWILTAAGAPDRAVRNRNTVRGT